MTNNNCQQAALFPGSFTLEPGGISDSNNNQVIPFIQSAIFESSDVTVQLTDLSSTSESLTIQREEELTLNVGNSQLILCPPTLPIATLPTVIKNGAELFATVNEQMLFVYSTLASISGTMNKIKGVYDQNTCYPNLFFIGIAPAASGKSVLMYPRTLISKIHQHFISQSKIELITYRRSNKKKKGEGSGGVIGELPLFKVVFIPANCSSSKLMQHLSDNNPDTPAVMIESEVDTLTTANSSDFGDYSDTLRKIFHNEALSISRKMNNDYYDVVKPQMSVVLSGTPGQVSKLFKNNENGLFSRFLCMSFNSNNGWKPMGPCPSCINISDHFEKQSSQYFDIWKFISKEELVVELTSIQWDSLNAYGNGKYADIITSHGTNATSIIKRHGIMLFKLCMVLTGFRKFESTGEDKTMLCTDNDFKTALFLVDQSLNSSLEIYDTLPSANLLPINQKRKDVFYALLPKDFLRSEAVEKAVAQGISVRSADRYLNELMDDKRLILQGAGRYSTC